MIPGDGRTTHGTFLNGSLSTSSSVAVGELGALVVGDMSGDDIVVSIMRVDALLKLVDEKASVGDYQLGGDAQGNGCYSFLVVVVAWSVVVGWEFGVFGNLMFSPVNFRIFVSVFPPPFTFHFHVDLH